MQWIYPQQISYCNIDIFLNVNKDALWCANNAYNPQIIYKSYLKNVKNNLSKSFISNKINVE
jgi:hypothetical protein